MAPFTHHQWPCLPGSPTHVVIQGHLQLSLLQHRMDGFDVDLSLRPCRQVPSMKYLSRWWQTRPDMSCSQICQDFLKWPSIRTLWKHIFNRLYVPLNEAIRAGIPWWWSGVLDAQAVEKIWQTPCSGTVVRCLILSHLDTLQLKEID